MKTLFARSTAGIALAVSLMGTAHAQNDDANDPAADSVQPKASAAYIMGEPATASEALVPSAMLKAFNASHNGAPQLSTALPGETLVASDQAQGGTVTLRSIEARYGDINPFYGDINPFYGDINPFYGNIGAFWGDINPFYGTINPFYGDINPFWGDISPFYGDITPFWGDIGAFYGDIVAFDSKHLEQFGNFWEQHHSQISLVETKFDAIIVINGSILRDGAPNRMMAALADLVSQGESQFGAAYTAKTGNSFDTLVDEVFARHGAYADAARREASSHFTAASAQARQRR